MTAKRFTVPKQYRCIQDNQTEEKYLCEDKSEAIALANLLNALHELADGNEEQLLKVMTYLHDNHYEIWEEVNKECYE